MIQVLTVAPLPNGSTRFLFKLSEPQDHLDKDSGPGEFMTERMVQLGLGGEVFKALGYRWFGGQIDAQDRHQFWYKNVERDRFKDGPLYMEVTFDSSRKKIMSVRKFTPVFQDNQAVAVHQISGSFHEALAAPEN